MSKIGIATVHRNRLATAAVVIASLAIAGCGGNSGDDTSDKGDGGGSGQLSHAALVARANAVCRTAGEGVARIPVAGTLEELAEYAAGIERITRGMHDELKSLKPPASDRVNFNRYLEALTISNEQLTAMQAAASRRDDGAVRTAVSKIAGADVGLAAANAGFGICAAAASQPSS